MKYMVMTTKHHEGFCLFATKLTDYCAPKQASPRPGRRIRGCRASRRLRFGFYYPLMDSHHPDGARCADRRSRPTPLCRLHPRPGPRACTNYGKIDVLWYDVNWPLKPEGWESEKMNKMVRGCSPNHDQQSLRTAGDFATPEQRIQAADALGSLHDDER